MIAHIMTCDGCGKRAEYKDESEVKPAGWHSFRIAPSFSSRISPEFHACSAECGMKAAEDVLRKLFETGAI